jgi:hypothetical protein
MGASLQRSFRSIVHNKNIWHEVSTWPTYSFGNRRNMSPSLSIGATSSPMAVSNGFASSAMTYVHMTLCGLTGLSGAEGWLRVGTNFLVRSKSDARLFESSRDRTSSSLGRSSCSSSFDGEIKVGV